MKFSKTVFLSLTAATLMTPIAFAQTAATAPAETTTPATTTMMERPMLRKPSMMQDSYTTISAGDISTENLEGADVYGPDDTEIGEVEGLVLNADGTTVDHIVLDIGGFLGMGVHQVALTPNEVQIMRKGTSDDIRLYVDATKAELEAQPEYKK